SRICTWRRRPRLVQGQEQLPDHVRGVGRQRGPTRLPVLQDFVNQGGDLLVVQFASFGQQLLLLVRRGRQETIVEVAADFQGDVDKIRQQHVPGGSAHKAQNLAKGDHDSRLRQDNFVKTANGGSLVK